jgi:hypothetical protein
MESKLMPCRRCNRRAIIESWSSGGMMYMVKCSNPDCPIESYEEYPRGHNLPQVIQEWNRRNADDHK